jgi:uncharacterized repeat protein (TIGR03803 family)
MEVKRMTTIRQFILLIAATAAWASACATASAQYTLTTIAEFDYFTTGNGASSLIADASGNLYSTTVTGGTNQAGTVFEVAAGTHALSALVEFNGTNGMNPSSALVADASGNLYGTTSIGGANGDGIVFKLAASTHAFSTLATFNTTVGAEPSNLVFGSTGNLYGTAAGGANSEGIVFQVAAGTHALSTIATFNGTNGSSHFYGLNNLIADTSGNLYGTTLDGGTNGDGTVYEVAAGTHALSTLATCNGTNGVGPNGVIADASGNLYGTTQGGGANGDGTVFEVAAGTHALSTLATFNGTNGMTPVGGLIADANGNLYGTTERGGTGGYGTVFEIAAGSHTLSTLAAFNFTDGNVPFGLVMDSQGNFYGTAEDAADGMVFELSPVPEPSTLASAVCGLAIMLLISLQRTARKQADSSNSAAPRCSFDLCYRLNSQR